MIGLHPVYPLSHRARTRRQPAVSNLEHLPAALADARAAQQDLALVADILGPYLEPLDYDVVPADPILVEAGILYASTTTGTKQLPIARYAHTAAARLHPDDHPHRLAATSTLARALHTHAEHDEAIDLYSQAITAYDTLGAHRQATSHRTHLAACLHDTGYCAEAIAVITGAWSQWRRRPDTYGAISTGRDLLYTCIGILSGCGHEADLRSLLLQASRSPLAGQLDIAGLLPDPAVVARHRQVCLYRLTSGRTGQRPLR